MATTPGVGALFLDPMHNKRIGGVFLVVIALFLSLIDVAGAQEDEAPASEIATLNMRALRATSGAVLVPIELTVSSLDRAIDGSLIVEAPDISVSWDIGVRLAANTEATQVLLVPISSFGIELAATLVVDDEDVAETDLEILNGDRGNENVIGVIGVDSPEREVPLFPEDGDASVIELSSLELLPGLDSVVVSPSGMRSLSADEQAQLLNWVGAGRQLVVADKPGALDESLPAGWVGPDSIIAAGSGFIRYVGPDWATSVPKGPTNATSPQFSDFSGVSHNEITSDAGFRVPGIRVIASILGIYLLLAGPVLFIVLGRRNRRSLVWLALPALAAVCTVGVVIVGTILTQGRGNGHATIVEVSPVGATLTDRILVSDSGDQTIELPPGYTLTRAGLGSRNRSGAAIVLRPTAGTDTMSFEIDQGSGGSAVLQGQTDQFADVFVIDNVRVKTDEITGSVRNNTTKTLADVLVIMGNRIADVGDIPAGAAEPFAIDLTDRARQSDPELRAWDIDGQVSVEDFFFEGPGRGFGDNNAALDEGPINGSAWIEWRTSRTGTDTPSGLLTAVGWTREINASLLDGQGRTAFVARAGLSNTNGPVHPDTIRNVSVGSSADFFFEDFGGGRGFDQSFQLIRPPGADTSQVAFAIGEQVTEFNVWVEEDWRSFELPDRGRVEFAIPEEAWQDNVLWAEAKTDGFFGEPGFTNVELEEVDDRTDTVALLPAGETFQRQGFGGFDEPFQDFDIELNETLTVELDENLSFEGEGDISNTYDEWVVELLDGDEVTVQMNRFGDNLDPYLIVRDPDGDQIAENDDFQGLDSRLQFTARTDGAYTIETRPLSGGGPGGSYEVIIEVER